MSQWPNLFHTLKRSFFKHRRTLSCLRWIFRRGFDAVGCANHNWSAYCNFKERYNLRDFNY